MGRPLDHLNPIQSPGEPGKGDIQDRNSFAGAAEPGPEGFGFDKLAGPAGMKIVCAGLYLGQAMEPMTRRVEAGVKGGPGGSFIEALDAGGFGDQASGEEGAQHRQGPVAGPVAEQALIPGIDSQEHDFGPGFHGDFAVAPRCG